MFTHVPLPIYKLEVGYDDSGRYYISPSGSSYRSVTTVTSFYGKDKLDKWRKRVGEAEAARISNEAASVGTDFHQMCEDYFLGVFPRPFGFIAKNLFNSVKPTLDRIDNIRLLESNLYSDRLQLAGSVDCVAEFDGVLSIIDFKTSKKEKPLDWIENYFVQETIYAIMVLELYQLPVKQIVTIISCRNMDVEVVVKPITKELLDLVKLYISHYRENHV